MRILLATALAALAIPARAEMANRSVGENDPTIPHREELREGHLDLLVLYEEAEGLHLALAAGEHDHDHEHAAEVQEHDHLELDQAEVVGGPQAAQVTPGAGAWGFLGEADRYVYLLPQAEVAGLPFLGLNSEELDAGQFTSGPTLTLQAVDGPGDFFLYQVDAFGQPVVLMNSADPAADAYTLALGTHVHANWAFTQPGEYALTLEVRATRTDGTVVTSAPQVLFFHLVGPPTYLHEGHADIGLHYEVDHGLSFHVAADGDHHHPALGLAAAAEEHEHGSAMHLSDVTFLLGGYAVREVPEAAAYSFLGAPGSRIHLAGQQQAEGVPFIGWNTEELDPAVFTGDVAIELHGVTGPGQVFLYQVDAFGAVTVLWDSAAAGEDTLTLPPGLHRHFNLAVTAPGTYELELHATASLAAGGDVQAHAILHLQAGGLEGYFGHFHRHRPHWLFAETGGWFYTASWPWLWSPDQGWIHAAGPGGPDHYYYRFADQHWLWTSPAVFPYYWSYGTSGWQTWDDVL